jgi:8-oxo-dGTP diphosphatase
VPAGSEFASFERMLVENQEGHRLLRLAPLAEQDLSDLSELTHARVVARYEGKVLLVFEREKQRWELAGGAMNPGESARDCAARELREESSNDCRPEQLRFVGVFELLLGPSRFRPEPHTEYGALYEIELERVAAFIPNDEIGATLWWDGAPLSHDLDEIDRKLAEICPRPTARLASG